ncbi:hypothetical protein A3F66_05200 [candidate division TM6 bacterium RIFCSPHIGHO2_12_FULL_32_22]|nr:MAG: hypothetical protein A3F66_05200 [candidate division TM6 bacterium RIFCSPHIGHO2_12_FULL_32_22]
MKNITTQIALNYLFKNEKLNSINSMIKVCFFSIFIATTSLAISFFIMSGFEKETNKKLKNINPDIIISSYGNSLNYKKIAPILNEYSEIESFSPIDNQYAILEKKNEVDLNKILMIRAINPELESKVTNLENLVAFPKNNLDALLTNNRVLIGKKLAILEQFNTGDKFNIVIAQKNKKKIDLKSYPVEVAGILDIGIDELDNNLVICSLNYLNNIFNKKEVSQINIKLKNLEQEQEIINKLKKRFNIDAYSWKELNPAIMSALKLEKYITFFILSLLIFIASMNMISLIYMLITRKRKEIAILITLGLSIKKIQKIFLIITTTISAGASMLGILTAVTLAKLIEISKIKIPAAYFVETLPVNINMTTLILILLTSILLTIVATISPIKSLDKLNISEILRFD